MMNEGTVAVNCRLRPLRLVFLVRLTDSSALTRVVQTNTCLWGGRFNAIIPLFRRLPRTWSDRPFLSASAREIVKGYLDAFEPDYVVTTAEGLGDGLGIAPHYLIKMEEVFNPSVAATTGFEEIIEHGVDIRELYVDLYEKRFRFAERRPPDVVVPEFTDRRLALFGATCFGAFPTAGSASSFRRSYEEIFGARVSKVNDGGSLYQTLLEQNTPLQMGSAGLRIRPRGYVRGPNLFFMDATSTLDLVDYWNLRAIGWDVLPVPRQWSDTLVGPCAALVDQNYVPFEEGGRSWRFTTLLVSRSTTEAEAAAFGRQIVKDGQQSLSLQRWYPRIWNEWARTADHVLRCNVVAAEERTDVTVAAGVLSFNGLSPRFVKRGLSGSPQWANVVQFRDFGRVLDAPVIPAGISNLDRLLRSATFEQIRSGGEGIVVVCRRAESRHRWTLPSATDVFRTWLGERSYQISLSGAGRVVNEMIRMLGGTLGIHSLAHEELIKLLNDMASGLIYVEIDEDTGTQPRRVQTKVLSVGEWRSRLRALYGNDDARALGVLEFLTRQRALAGC